MSGRSFDDRSYFADKATAQGNRPRQPPKATAQGNNPPNSPSLRGKCRTKTSAFSAIRGHNLLITWTSHGSSPITPT